MMIAALLAATVLSGGTVTNGETRTDFAAVLARPVLQNAEYMGYATAYRHLAAADLAVDETWRVAAASPDFESFRRRVYASATNSFGGFPARTPLNPRTTGTRKCRGYRLEKLIVESRPGFFVPACVYVPDDPKFKAPYPAVLVPCGHTEDGKATGVYQSAGLMLARAGFVAAVFDPIDQGERRQVPDHGTCGKGHNAMGALAMLLGESGLRIRLWDAMRMLDYLETRPDVDPSRLGVMGNSGGGTMSAMLAAFDGRIRAAAPASYISNLRRVVDACGPQDSEQILFGQLAWGLNHLGLVLLRAPTPTLVCASHDDFFPIDGTLETMRAVGAVAGKAGWSDRYALMESSGKHGWKYGMLTASVDWMRRWLCGNSEIAAPDSSALRLLNTAVPSADVCRDDVLAERETFATETGNVSCLPDSRSAFQVLSDDLADIERARPRQTASERAESAVRAAGMRPLASLGVKTVEITREATNGVAVIRLGFVSPDGFTMPGVLLTPERTGADVVPLLAAGDGGRRTFAADVASALATGRPALVVDLEGFGEIGVTKRRIHIGSCVDDGLGKIHYLLGASLVGRRAEQLLAAAGEMRRRFGRSPELLADGRAVIPAAHAYAADPQLLPVVSRRNVPLSWAQAVRRSVTEPVQWTFSDSVQGALRNYDWPELLPRR